jgi:hypothetical protein
MEKSKVISALATVSLAVVVLIAYVSPASGNVINNGRSRKLSQVGSNRLLQAGRVSKDAAPFAGILTSALSTRIPDGLQQQGIPIGDAPVDFSGDGRTDFVVVRNTGGGPNGQLTWFYQQNGGPANSATSWGLNSDWVLSEDFDGDQKDDIVVWRGGPAGTAAFYILQSSTSTLRVIPFGQDGDVPSVVADYDNDGMADAAVYRGSSPAFWFYLPSSNPGGGINAVQWGTIGDILAPGDFDGDGRNDFGIARNNGSGGLDFWRLLSTGVSLPVVTFGTPSDFYVPGDYDGDSKTDIATARQLGSGTMRWQFISSATGNVITGNWGAANDLPVQGDYDGDGLTDFAVWRRGVNPGESAFWVLNSSTGGFSVTPWGQPADFPVAAAFVF